MKWQKMSRFTPVLTAVLGLAISTQSLLPARAQDMTSLKAETAVADITPSPIFNDAPKTPTDLPVVLQGKAHKHLQTTNMDGTAESTASAAPGEPLNPLRAQAEKKFDAGQPLSAEEYRSLEAGCAGYESDRKFFQHIAIVSVVYKDSPAEKAGLKKGDKILDQEEDNAEAIANPGQPQQEVTCGRAGTPVTITVMRDGHPQPITMLRMNIEDIQESKYRKEWEQVLRRLGYPTEGSFAGTSLKSLKPLDQ